MHVVQGERTHGELEGKLAGQQAAVRILCLSRPGDGGHADDFLTALPGGHTTMGDGTFAITVCHRLGAHTSMPSAPCQCSTSAVAGANHAKVCKNVNKLQDAPRYLGWSLAPGVIKQGFQPRPRTISGRECGGSRRRANTVVVTPRITKPPLTTSPLMHQKRRMRQPRVRRPGRSRRGSRPDRGAAAVLAPPRQAGPCGHTLCAVCSGARVMWTHVPGGA